MLSSLSIKNIALVDTVQAQLTKGFNVITGETGSGKSLILSAFSFLLGERVDSSQIRQGAASASVEALFEIKNEDLLTLLRESGIETEGNEVLIKRELHTTGKTKVFINNQQAQVTLLKKIAPRLILTSNQHAHLTLLADGAPLAMIDTYRETGSLLSSYKQAFEEETKLSKEIDKMTQALETRQKELEEVLHDIQEIEKTKLKQGEEEELDQELSRLAHVDEIATRCGEALRQLDSEKSSVLETLARQRQALEKVSHLDAKLHQITSSFSSAYTELKDTAYELKQYTLRLESNPDRLHFVQERLKTLSLLKRKYGTSIEEILGHLSKLKERKSTLENHEIFLDEKKKKLIEAKAATSRLADKLTKERREGAKALSKLITKELHELNMPHAIFEIALEKCDRTSSGQDACFFYLTPNLGEKRISVKEAASGGELARLALAFQTILLQKLSIPTILFDEIDANIGGKTATIVGKKLQALGTAVQVISITHFPQVASHADNHFCITKQERDGRTITSLHLLEKEEERVKELDRMAGKGI